MVAGWTSLKNKKYHGNLSEQLVLTSLPMVQELSAARHWKPSDVPASATSTPSDAPNTHSEPLISEVSTKIISEKKLRVKTQPSFTLSKLTGENGVDDLVAEVELPSVVSCNGHNNT